MVRVLFVCLGNICRSPTAEAVFRSHVEEAGLGHAVVAASAGTGAWHAGEGADPRSARAAKQRGYDLSGHSARAVAAEDFRRFDHVLAMDRDNLRQLRSMAARWGGDARIGLLLDHAPAVRFDEVPDPYAGGTHGFELVLDILEEGTRGFLQYLRANDLAPRGR